MQQEPLVMNHAPLVTCMLHLYTKIDIFSLIHLVLPLELHLNTFFLAYYNIPSVKLIDNLLNFVW